MASDDKGRRRTARKLQRLLRNRRLAHQAFGKRLAARLRTMPATTQDVAVAIWEREERRMVEFLRKLHPNDQRWFGQVLRDQMAEAPARFRDATVRATAVLMGDESC